MSNQQLSTNTFTTAKWIVSHTASDGTHTTIAAALTAASSGDTIFIRPGTYTENLTLVAGVNLTAFTCDAFTPNVIINGNCTFTGAGTVSITGIRLQTNSAAFLTVSGSAASIVMIVSCYLNCSNNTGITFSSSSSSAEVYIQNCTGNLGTTGIGLFAHSSAGTIYIIDTYFYNTGGSSTASTISAGLLTIFTSTMFSPITSSGTSEFGITQSNIDTSAQNATCITAGGSGDHVFNNSSFTSGSASAISISNTTTVTLCYIYSTNTNAVTGAGTISYQGLVFPGASSLINTTTQNGGLLKGGQIQTPTAGFIGERIAQVNSAGQALSTGTNSNVASVALTAGVWDISISCSIVNSLIMTIMHVGISSQSAVFQGSTGDQIAEWTYGSGIASLTLTLGIPAFRVVLTSPATYYLVAVATFSSGTSTAYGRISAVRVA